MYMLLHEMCKMAHDSMNDVHNCIECYVVTWTSAPLQSFLLRQSKCKIQWDPTIGFNIEDASQRELAQHRQYIQ